MAEHYSAKIKAESKKQSIALGLAEGRRNPSKAIKGKSNHGRKHNS
jgi:hypothetical protein